MKAFTKGEIVKCHNFIWDGYDDIGDYNIVIPVPFYAIITDIYEKEYLKYEIKPIRIKNTDVEKNNKYYDKTYKMAAIYIEKVTIDSLPLQKEHS